MARETTLERSPALLGVVIYRYEYFDFTVLPLSNTSAAQKN
jgi:hypothetical protein